jgi:outer membrane protein assembly factor BamB
VDAKAGRRIWTLDAGKPEISSPVIADGVIYFVSNDGHVYAVK